MQAAGLTVLASPFVHACASEVVVTGSQIPMSVALNDGIANLLGALVVATHYETPEVMLYFHAKAMRGNRTT